MVRSSVRAALGAAVRFARPRLVRAVQRVLDGPMRQRQEELAREAEALRAEVDAVLARTDEVMRAIERAHDVLGPQDPP